MHDPLYFLACEFTAHTELHLFLVCVVWNVSSVIFMGCLKELFTFQDYPKDLSYKPETCSKYQSY